MIKAILFDYAGVIGTEWYWGFLRNEIGNINERETDYVQLADDVDDGSISVDEFFAKLAVLTGHDESELRKIENDNRFACDQRVIDVIKNVRANGYVTGLLSNYSASTLRPIMSDLGITDIFDHLFISSEMQAIKPHPEIFKKALEILGLAPDEVIFIDDRQENIDGARAVGMHGIVYSKFEDLQNAFKNTYNIDI